METTLEEYVVYEPIFLVAGSSVGGLLLLALITVVLYKVNCCFQVIFLTQLVSASSSAMYKIGQ